MLMITPGLRVVECGATHVQVGLDPSVRVRLPADPATMRALTEPAAHPSTHPVVATLRGHGCVVDDDELAARRRRRTSARVRVLGDLGDHVRALLTEAGLREAPPDAPATCAVVLSRGELDRDLVSRLVRADTPHVLGRLIDSVVLLGPFVHPGHTACLHCVDLHRAVEDPFHLAIGQRYTEALRRERPDGCPDPAEPVEAALAAALLCRDLLTWLDGGTPWTWSRELRVGAEEAWSDARSWLRHPACGCAWQAAVGSPDTMEA